MIVRMVVCVGFIAMAYFVGKEVGRTESVRDQLRRAAEDGDGSMPGTAVAEDQVS